MLTCLNSWILNIDSKQALRLRNVHSASRAFSGQTLVSSVLDTILEFLKFLYLLTSLIEKVMVVRR